MFQKPSFGKNDEIYGLLNASVKEEIYGVLLRIYAQNEALVI